MNMLDNLFIPHLLVTTYNRDHTVQYQFLLKTKQDYKQTVPGNIWSHGFDQGYSNSRTEHSAHPGDRAKNKIKKPILRVGFRYLKKSITVPIKYICIK
jgi:hypothetical protein